VQVEANPIVLYDGICGLCNRLNQFILRHDHEAIFRFASLQSVLAAKILSRCRASASDLDTVYVVVNADQPDEHLLSRSDAIIFILKHLGVAWRVPAAFYGVLPKFLRDWLYNCIARNRYRVFGRFETCPIPSPATRGRFLDI
jgi:predicted DCC family thiol-disulfide oxidoreductase YuxK